jgi:hypothetical protein
MMHHAPSSLFLSLENGTVTLPMLREQMSRWTAERIATP